MHAKQKHQAVLIVNPNAARPPHARRIGVARDWLAQRGWTLERCTTRAPGHAVELAAKAAADGVEAVVACGGDGTINEVVNGIAGTPTALAVLPAGTVNVWARETGIPREPLAALRLLVEGERRRVDLGRAGERRFLMLASVGTDSYAVAAVSPALKRRWGRLAFLALGVKDLLTRGGRPLTIEVAGRTLSQRALVAIVGNSRLYGGALKATHRARIDDGLLDLALYTGRGWQDLAAHALRTFLGRHARHRGVIYTQAKAITIAGERPLPAQVDGEYAGRTPMTFAVEPSALTVVIPAGLGPPLFTPVKPATR